MTRDAFDFRAYTRLKQLEHLLRTGQIDDQFYWLKANRSKSLTSDLSGTDYDLTRTVRRAS
jgi:hypothetical protein